MLFLYVFITSNSLISYYYFNNINITIQLITKDHIS